MDWIQYTHIVKWFVLDKVICFKYKLQIGKDLMETCKFTLLLHPLQQHDRPQGVVSGEKIRNIPMK